MERWQTYISKKRVALGGVMLQFHAVALVEKLVHEVVNARWVVVPPACGYARSIVGLCACDFPPPVCPCFLVCVYARVCERACG